MCPKKRQHRPASAAQAAAEPWPRRSAGVLIWIQRLGGYLGRVSQGHGCQDGAKLGICARKTAVSTGVARSTPRLHMKALFAWWALATNCLDSRENAVHCIGGRWYTYIHAPYIAIGCALDRPSCDHGPHWNPTSHEDDSFRLDVGEILWGQRLRLLSESRLGHHKYVVRVQSMLPTTSRGRGYLAETLLEKLCMCFYPHAGTEDPSCPPIENMA